MSRAPTRFAGPCRSPFALSVVALAFAAATARAAAPPPLLGHAVEYVIVTSGALAPSFLPLVDWKIHKGVPAAIVTIEDIRADYSIAADDAERVRRFLTDARLAGVRWALIGGDTDVIPIRYARTTFFGGADLPTDLYYACLDGDWNADGDGYYGEGRLGDGNPGDQADLVADVFVGRAPVRTPAEAARVVSRTIQYERAPAGDYEDTRLFAAEVLFPEPWNPGDPVTLDGAEIVEPLLPILDAHGLPATRLYENHTDPNWRPGAFPETPAAVRDSLNRGYGFVTLVGRGNTGRYSAGAGFLGTADALGLTNAARPFLAWFVSSSVCQPDSGSFGEALLRAPAGGAVACIGPGHYGFPAADRQLLETFMRVVHDSSEARIARAIARTRQPFLPFAEFDGVQRWTQMALELFGDPELTMWMRRPLALHATHPALASPGQPIVVDVSAGGSPLAGARVTFYQPGHELGIVGTDASGRARFTPLSAVDGLIALTVSADGFRPFEAYIMFGSATATTASLMSQVVMADRVSLTWDTPGWHAFEVTLERRDADGESWLAAGRVEPGGVGVIATVDDEVRAGARYGYRLARRAQGVVEYSAEAAIRVPAAAAPRLALERIAPHPITPDSRLTLTLAGGGDATLRVLDLAGRVRWTRTLPGASPGRREVTLDGVERLPPGLYFIRLSEGGASRSRRIVVR